MIDLPWHELRGDVRRFVAARVAPSDVDDVVQETLVRVHHGIGSLRDHERLGAWIHRVARHAIVDHHRRARHLDPLPDELAAVPEPIDDPAIGMLVRCVTPFVAMLPPVYRQAITLVELEGRSQVEAAAQLGVPLSTMKARVQRGRARLRELVDTCCAVALDARGGVLDVTPRGGRCVAC